MKNDWRKFKKKLKTTKKKRRQCGKNWTSSTKNSRTLKSTKEQERKKCLLRLFNQHRICSRVNKDIYLFLLALDRSGKKKLCKKKLLFETQNPHLSRASNDGLSIIVDSGQVRNKSLGSNVYIINVLTFFFFQ